MHGVPRASRPHVCEPPGVTKDLSRRLWVALVLAGCGASAPPSLPSPSALDTLELVQSFPVDTELGDPSLREAHVVWVEAIDRARQRIDLLHFYGASVPEGRLEPVIAALERAARRGVRLRLVFDEGFYARQPEVPDRLAAMPGAELRRLDLRPLAGGVQHAKLFVVDGREAFVGSQNFDWRSLEHIHELGLRVTSPRLVAEVVALFELDWALAGGASREDAQAAVAAPAPATHVERFAGAEVRVRFVASPRAWLPRPDDAGWEWPLMRDALATARTRVRLAVMSYPLRGHGGETWLELDQALRDAAARGVRVELLASSWETRPGRIEALQALARVPNVEVRLVFVPEHSSGFIPYARTVHAKYLTVDGERAWIGTSNAGGDYFLRSRNAGFFVEGAPFVRTLDAVFERAWTSSLTEAVDPDRRYDPPRVSARAAPGRRERL